MGAVPPINIWINLQIGFFFPSKIIKSHESGLQVRFYAHNSNLTYKL